MSCLLMLEALLLIGCSFLASARLLLSSSEDSFLGLTNTDADQGAPRTCTSLKNHQTHFTVEIGVGTPPQKFDVVADTGSDSVIVNSCICNELGHCSAKDSCFKGANHSETFSLAGFDPKAEHPKVEEVVLTFGSGQIEAIIASDVVSVGKASAHMDNGVLLMVNKALSFNGPFEGILGLGLPREMVQKEGASAAAGAKVYQSRGFLQAAGVPRFSMCFNYEGNGVLRLGGPEEKLELGSVGKVHWGLDFRGITVLPAAAAAPSSSTPSLLAASRLAEGAPVVAETGVRTSFCDASKMAPGQETPCGAIPDSGTTLFMGPKDHIAELFDTICDQWPKCAAKAAEEEAADVPKHKVFQSLLLHCEAWLESDGFLEAMPILSFHLVGAQGKTTEVKIPPAAYITELVVEEVKYVKKYLGGIFPVEVAVPTGKNRKVCTPSFGATKYNTKMNGPVWILGTPLFYEYQVGYDLSADPPSISFSTEPCGACRDGAEVEAAADSKTALLTRSRSRLARSTPIRPRPMTGEPLVPDLDTNLPL